MEDKYDLKIPAMITVPEFAKLMRISRNTAYTLVNSGQIPCIKIGKQIRIYRCDLEKFIRTATSGTFDN